MAHALESLGKRWIVNATRLDHYREFRRRKRIEIASERGSGRADVMECSVWRTASEGLDSHYIINIDHRRQPDAARSTGSTNWLPPAAKWFDDSRARVRLSEEIATHIYLAILTDTGSFHH